MEFCFYTGINIFSLDQNLTTFTFMTLQDLQIKIKDIIDNFKNTGNLPKENDLYDYKLKLNFSGDENPIEIFLKNFAKDILSFCNGNGGIILLGFEENKVTGKYIEVGLDDKNLQLLSSIDLNLVNQKFEKIVGLNVSIDLQKFQVGTKEFYYLLVAKQNQVLIPKLDFKEYNIKKGEIIYRTSGKNAVANDTTQEFNNFLQIKADEKKKEFMEIWSKLLPEIFNINPREVLIISPKNNKIYGFNGKDNILSSSEIEIDKSKNGVFNVILNAISAGEIGKISNDAGKPLYKIVGEISTRKDYILMTTLEKEVVKDCKYAINNLHLKIVMRHLGWVNDEKFKVENPEENTVNPKFDEYIWIENFDSINNNRKVVFSQKSIKKIISDLNNEKIHTEIFGKNLKQKLILPTK